MINSHHKGALRNALRAQRRALSSDQQAVAADKLLTQLQSVAAFLAAMKIALYLTHDGEIDPIEVMKWCWNNSKQTYLPIIVQAEKNTLLFANVNEQTEYQENRFGIKQPLVEPHQMIQAQNLDLILMPLVAFDQKGNRVGMGGGFYDTTFAFLKEKPTEKPQLIGIAHEIQRVDDISVAHWDIPVSTVVTDRNIYNRHL